MFNDQWFFSMESIFFVTSSLWRSFKIGIFILIGFLLCMCHLCNICKVTLFSIDSRVWVESINRVYELFTSLRRLSGLTTSHHCYWWRTKAENQKSDIKPNIWHHGGEPKIWLKTQHMAPWWRAKKPPLVPTWRRHDWYSTTLLEKSKHTWELWTALYASKCESTSQIQQRVFVFASVSSP